MMKFRVSVLCKKVIPPYSGRFWTLQSPCRRPFTNECSAVNLSPVNFSLTNCMFRLSVAVVSFRHNLRPTNNLPPQSVLTLAAYRQATRTHIESDGTICCLYTTMSS